MSSWTHTSGPQQVHFAPGSISTVGRVLAAVGGRRALLVTTAGRLESEAGGRLQESLGARLASTFAGARSHVPTTVVEEATRQARRDGVDCIVSFGGGSCSDLGKAVAFFTEQEQGAPGTSYLDRPLLPHVSVPTTYSGAELTPFFGMTDERARRKSGAGGPTVSPVAAVYDPEVTLSTPPRVSAETGMNALAHCVECAYSPARTPEAEAIALAGVGRIASSLPDVVAEPTDLEARTRMLEGAALGGRALLNASMGVHHGLAQLLGGRTGMAHGLANAVILPHAMRFNAEAVPDELTAVARAMGGRPDPEGAVDAVAELLGRLDLPTTLSECGVDEGDLDTVARLAEGSPAVRANPRPVTGADVRSILEAAY